MSHPLAAPVKTFVERDNEIREYCSILKDKRQELEDVRERITHYMLTEMPEKDRVVLISDGKLVCRKRKVKETLNRVLIEKRITEWFKGDKSSANSLIEYIYNSPREVVGEKHVLCRVRNKKPVEEEESEEEA